VEEEESDSITSTATSRGPEIRWSKRSAAEEDISEEGDATILHSDGSLRGLLYGVVTADRPWVFESCRWTGWTLSGWRMEGTDSPNAAMALPKGRSAAGDTHLAPPLQVNESQLALLLTDSSLYIIKVTLIHEARAPARPSSLGRKGRMKHRSASTSSLSPQSPLSDPLPGSPAPRVASKRRTSRWSPFRLLRRLSVDAGGGGGTVGGGAAVVGKGGVDGQGGGSSAQKPPLEAQEEEREVDEEERHAVFDCSLLEQFTPGMVEAVVLPYRTTVMPNGDEVAVRSSDLRIRLSEDATRRFLLRERSGSVSLLADDSDIFAVNGRGLRSELKRDGSRGASSWHGGCDLFLAVVSNQHRGELLQLLSEWFKDGNGRSLMVEQSEEPVEVLQGADAATAAVDHIPGDFREFPITISATNQGPEPEKEEASSSSSPAAKGRGGGASGEMRKGEREN